MYDTSNLIIAHVFDTEISTQQDPSRQKSQGIQGIVF